MREVYLDNCATTRTDNSVAQVALDVMTSAYGNPSSLHGKGLEAQLRLERARGKLAGALGCEPGEIYFTSGGTEANNLALLGGFAAHRRKGNSAVGGQAEHSSVRDALAHLEAQGAQVTLLPPQADGLADPDAYAAAITADTLLVSCALVNSEAGGVSDIARIARAAKAKAKRALIHCDAVQALGKVPLNVRELGVDLLSVSGHKLHAPKGVGALYVRGGVRILPLLHGGQQQKGLRPGTESVPLACALGAAAEMMTANLSANTAHFAALRELFLKKAENFVGVCINSAQLSTPYICNVSVPGYGSETLLHFLAERGVFVSSGSACAKGRDSHVLSAMGLPRERIRSALRVCFCKDNTTQDIEDFFAALQAAVHHLVRSK